MTGIMNFEDEKIFSRNQHSSEENKENITLIWFKPVPDKVNNIEQIKDQLRTVNDFLLCPLDIDSCIAQANSIKEERIFLITTISDAYQLLPKIINLDQLDSIFLFPANPEECMRLKEDFPKIVGIFDNIDDLISSIEETTKHVYRQMEVISFYDQHQRCTRDLSKQSPDFLWFRLFKDVIDHLPHDDGTKEEMLRACEQYYRDNYRVLTSIQRFREEYHPDDCIKWYTKDTFVFKLINKALRTEDIEQLYIYRYYIADLSQQLTKRCRMMKDKGEKKMTLYRGAVISQTELEMLQSNVGRLFAANSYWSTSRSRSYALTFAKKCLHSSDVVGVMYEIDCDLEDDSVIAADISELSVFSVEEEVLFDAGSIFRMNGITSSKENDIGVYVIEIRTTNEGQELAKQQIERNRVQMEEEGSRLMLSALLKRMGKHEKSLQFLQYLLENPDGEKLAYIHNRMGKALRDSDKRKDALNHFQEAYRLALSSNPPNRAFGAYILYNEGKLYARQRNNEKALRYYRHAVDMLNNEPGDHNSRIAQFYNSIGRIYRFEGDLDQALKYQCEVLQIRKHVMPDHAMNAFSYTAIGDIYYDQENYEQALEYHLKALELRRRLLPSTSHYIAWSLHQVGQVYYAMGEVDIARRYYLDALNIYHIHSSNQDVSHIRHDLAQTYSYKSQEALDHRLEAWELLKSLKYVKWFSLPRLAGDIAFTYKLMGNTKEALQFYKEALRIRERTLHQYSHTLLYSLNNLAYFYERVKDWTSALTYHRRALEIYEYYYHPHHWLCEKTRRSIQRIQQSRVTTEPTG